MKNIEPQDAPLGIVAMKPEGPWHVLYAEDASTPAGDTSHHDGERWSFWGDILCRGDDAPYLNFHYLRIPADLPPGARLCKKCEMVLRRRKNTSGN